MIRLTQKSKLVLLLFFFSASVMLSFSESDKNKTYPRGNVIFIHPDGTSITVWNTVRMLYYGPDSEINWDKLPYIGIYRGHLTNSLTATSNGGGTVHAYGVKVSTAAYGSDNGEIPTSRSGVKMSIMKEAIKSGIKCGIINSGNIDEPGTGVFLANDNSRANSESIALSIIKSRADVIMSGGEEWLIPVGVKGKHCKEGKRTDGKNLIKLAKQNGYTIVYTLEELLQIPDDTEKLLGVFAEDHTFNDKTEEDLAKLNLPLYQPWAPTLAEMTEAAIKILSRNNSQFFLVVEEEGTDNFGNKNNAIGMLEALKRSDDALGVALKFESQNSNTMIITCSDSEAGGMEAIGFDEERLKPNEPIQLTDPNGSFYDGINGKESLPFISAPDKSGRRFPFVVSWSTYSDVSGSVVVRAAGLNSEFVKGSVDNTDIYKFIYLTLFGKLLN